MKTITKRISDTCKIIILFCVFALVLFSNMQMLYTDVMANDKVPVKMQFKVKKDESWRKKFRIKPYRDLQATKINRFSNQLNKLLQRFAFYESEGQWKIYNEYGYMGKYQFGSYAMIALKKPHITTNVFRYDPYVFPPDVQDSSVVTILYLNYLTNKPTIDANNGRYINGIQLNHFNMMVAMNHVGCGGFLPYLSSNGKIVPKDGNGSTIEFYLNEFENVDIDLEEMKKIKEQLLREN